MPVTELAWIPSATLGSVPPAFIEAGRKGMEAQSEWAAKHASSTLPSGPPAARGAALYQQREDRGTLLITAHWDSVAQHLECIAGEENKQAMRAVAAHAVVAGIEISHVDGVRMLGAETLAAGLLSVVKIGVGRGEEGEEEEEGEGKRRRVEEIWHAEAKNLLAAGSGFEHAAGWRIERDQGKEDRDEFIIVGAWRDEDALSRFAEGKEWENAGAWDEAWKDVVLDRDVKTYSRVA